MLVSHIYICSNIVIETTQFYFDLREKGGTIKRIKVEYTRSFGVKRVMKHDTSISNFISRKMIGCSKKHAH